MPPPETGSFLDDGGSGSLVLPDVIVTKRNRTDSICGRIEDDVERGAVKYFCRSKGHGFIVPDNVRTSHSNVSRIYLLLECFSSSSLLVWNE